MNMKNQSLLIRLVALVAAIMCTLGVSAAEAYANYTPSNTTLTFYYDNLRSSRTGSTYDMNLGSNAPGWFTNGISSAVTQVIFDPSFANVSPTSTYDWFCNMQNLQSITGMEYLNTSEVTNMAVMFDDCKSLTSLDLTHFNTAKVTSMLYMFANCNNLRTIYVGSGWSTASATSNSYMFYNCTSLVGSQGTTYDANHTNASYAHVDGGPGNPGYFTGVTEAYANYTPSNTTLTFYCDDQRINRTGTIYDLNTDANDTDWETDHTNASVTRVVFDPSFADARPTTTYAWFFDMKLLQSIEGIDYLNTSEVTNMSWMFAYCNSLTSLDLSHFNTATVIRMRGMFYKCEGLQTIYVGSGWSTSRTSDHLYMFSLCSSLVGGMGTTYDEYHTDKAYAHVDGGASNPGYFTAPAEAYACYTPSNTTLTFYYDGLRYNRTGTTYDLYMGTADEWPDWYNDGSNANVTRVVFDSSFADARPTNTCYWFSGMTNLQSIIGITCLNTSEVTNMAAMFHKCTRLTSLDLSSLNTAKVTRLYNMFYNSTGLTSIDLSRFNTANVTNMGGMFRGCTGLKTVYVGNGWTTAAVSFSGNMFTNCTSIVGGKGTTYDSSHTDAAYARVDGGSGNPGYFTLLISLDEALNVEGGNIHFESTGDYPWQVMQEGDNLYAQSGNAGVASSTSTLTATVTATVGDILFFDFKAWGEGTTPLYDKCSFSINGVEQIAYGAYQNAEWETYSVCLPAGECTLVWRYSKDGSINNPGDYFAIDNVAIISGFLRGDVDGNGNVGISDVTALIDILLSGTPAPEAADCNQDNSVTIADVTTLIDYLLFGSW